MKKILLISLFTLTVLGFTLNINTVGAQTDTRRGSLDAVVQASVGQFYLNLYGFISPYASVILTSNGVYILGTTADAQGNFSISQVLIKKGFSGFCLDAIDFKRVGESYTCFSIPPATASVTMKDIFLPPTLGLSRTTVNEGGSATAFGYTMPGARVTLHMNNELIVVDADITGYYEFSLKNIKVGTYSLYATANYQAKNSLDPTKKLQLEALSKPKQISTQVAKTLTNWWDQLLKFLRNWLWNPLWLIIPILILIIILLRKLWGRKFLSLPKHKNHLLHHFWWMGY
jgi:hypothetical protein